MEGVVKDVPVPIADPPEAAVYHSMVPPVLVAAKETVPLPQRLPGVVEVIVGAVPMVTLVLVEYSGQ
jgi:hypothetical protein